MVTARPAITPVARTFPELFLDQVKRRGDALALRHKAYGIWHRVSWSEYGATVREIAAALLAHGLAPGDRVAILADNRPEWPYCHLGTMTAGGVTCGVYATSAPDQIRYVLAHSEARLLFVENEEQLEKTLPVLGDTRVEHVVVWDAKGLWGFTQERVQFLDDFVKQGRAFLEAHPECVDARDATIGPGDTAMVIYTSGTTGPPKAAMLSHHNILWSVESLLEAIPASEPDERISYLPFAHIFENYTSIFVPIRTGQVVSFAESMDTLFQNAREVSPTYFAGPPRIWEKLASTVDLRMADSTLLKRTLYRLAFAVGRRHARARRRGAVGPGLGLASGSSGSRWPSPRRRRRRRSCSTSSTPSGSRSSRSTARPSRPASSRSTGRAGRGSGRWESRSRGSRWRSPTTGRS
jgi:long-chain acyl-CoA synthetase